MTYRAKPVTQRDGSELQNSNCLMAAAAVGLDFHTLGAKSSSGDSMREYSGDSSGGTNSDEIERAWRSGYDEDPAVRDGRPWSDVLADLRDGRLVMLQVWHATVGGPCLSGSGAYGHGVSVAPEQHSDGRWLVADPWCKPPSWVWTSESKLKAGAEKWAEKMTYALFGAQGGRLRDVDPAQLQAVMRALFARWTPDNPAPRDPPGAKGGAGVLFASTRAQSAGGGSADVTINANGSQLASVRALDCGEGLNFYADADLTDQLGELGQDRTLPYIGPAVGAAPGLAVLLSTGRPYEDGQQRPSIVYVNPDHVGDPYVVETPDDPIAARDAAWRAWLDGDGNAPDRT